MTANRKLLWGGLIIAGVTGYMAYVGASSGWQYYVTADECAASLSTLQGKAVRVSGKVAPGTLHLATGRQGASFVLTGVSARVQTECVCTLPDHFGEGVDVLVEGRLEATGLLRGEKLITRCASKYGAQLPTSASNPGAPPLGRRDPPKESAP